MAESLVIFETFVVLLAVISCQVGEKRKFILLQLDKGIDRMEAKRYAPSRYSSSVQLRLSVQMLQVRSRHSSCRISHLIQYTLPNGTD